jgi:hypothetical protein
MRSDRGLSHGSASSPPVQPKETAGIKPRPPKSATSMSSPNLSRHRTSKPNVMATTIIHDGGRDRPDDSI